MVRGASASVIPTFLKARTATARKIYFILGNLISSAVNTVILIPEITHCYSGLDQILVLSTLKGQVPAFSILFQRQLGCQSLIKRGTVNHKVPQYKDPNKQTFHSTKCSCAFINSYTSSICLRYCFSLCRLS